MFFKQKLTHFLLAQLLLFYSGPALGAAWPSAAGSAFAEGDAMAPGPAFTPRSSAGRLRLFLFLCHTFHPFIGDSSPLGAGDRKPENLCAAILASCGGLFRRGGRRWRSAARTPRGALLALPHQLLLPLQIFIEPYRQILDDHVLYAQPPLEFGDQLAVVRPDLLVHVNSFAVLGHAVSQLARAPVLGLLDFAALFGARVLDARENFLDLLLRCCRPGDKDQVVQTLFHDCLVSLLFQAQCPGKSFISFLPARPRTACAGYTWSSPHRFPWRESFPRRRLPRRSFLRRLPNPPSSSALAHTLCGWLTGVPGHSRTPCAQTPAFP